MSGSKEAAEKRRVTLLKKYGEEGLKQKQREWARAGGLNSGGPHLTKEQLSAAGKKGYQAMIRKVREKSDNAKVG